jgi:biopolymer transport protein ExbD
MSSQPSQGEPLNLVPIMNLVTILIPFLLMAATFVSLAVVDSALPGIIDDDFGPDDPPQSVVVAITTQGFTVIPNDESLNELLQLEIPCTPVGCPTASSYDTARLTTVLSDVKDARPNSETVILLPESSVPYEVLIAAMDAARNEGDRDLYPYVVIAGGTN